MNQNPFNIYELNSNFLTPEGVNLNLPSWVVDQLYFYADRQKFEVIVKLWDNSSEYFYLIPAELNSNPGELPSVSFIEGQILQISTFMNSTLKP